MYSQQLPEPVRNRAMNLGDVGVSWLAGLDDLAQRILDAQNLQPGTVLHGGTESLVVDATTQDSKPVVIKFGLPGSANLATEALIYELAGGKGYAQLILHEPAHNVLVLEKLGNPLEHEHRPVTEEISILCQLMSSSWIDMTADDAAKHGLMNGSEKADWHINFLKDKLARKDLPCSKRVVDTAINYAQSRKSAHNADSAKIIHGDAHSLNTLATPVAGHYKFIDPDGLYGEPALDLCIPMREYNADLLQDKTPDRAQARCEHISQRSGVSTIPIWEWGFVERVSSAFVLADVGMVEESQQTFEVAEQICGITC